MSATDYSIMTITVDLTISEDLSTETPESGDDDVPEPELIQTWASAAYQQKKQAIVSLLITTSDDIQRLNKQYRNKDKPTNVLSFPMQSPQELDICLLGDIALCAAVIRQEAEQQSKSEVSHWAHMVVHGMLHLQGYDHIDDKGASEMEGIEVSILNNLGYGNPYLVSE